MERWPNLYIVGAPKAGTTSLHAYLKESPDIFMSPIKEPNYFSAKTIPDNTTKKMIRDKNKYLELFKNGTNKKYLGESSPSYLSDSEAPKLIHEVSPNAKIIICLRDPVERIFSNYLMNYNLGKLKFSFHEAIQISLKEENPTTLSFRRLRGGLYFDDVKRYLEKFGSDNVVIIIFEELVLDLNKNVEKILNFLGVRYSIDFEKKTHNPYSIPRLPFASKLMTSKTMHKIIDTNLFPPLTRKFVREKILFKYPQKPKINEKDRKILVDYYNNDVNKLEKILGKKLPWKNFLTLK